jgi:hypothetical protein
MSTKGMSTTAARMLLDRLAPQIDSMLVLHDFDVSGFSIFGTLSADGRRYTFKNNLPLVDIGLRLADVAALDLQSEPVKTSGRWDSRAKTLAEHGASRDEIDFLQTRRVELNAMTAPVFIDFLERKLTQNNVRKVVPDHDILEQHARCVIEQRPAETFLRDNRPVLQARASSIALPEDLDDKVWSVLKQKPDLSWDEVVSSVVVSDMT